MKYCRKCGKVFDGDGILCNECLTNSITGISVTNSYINEAGNNNNYGNSTIYDDVSTADNNMNEMPVRNTYNTITENYNNANNSSNNNVTIENNQDFIFCRKCGKKLPNDSMFCSACGTKVLNEIPATDTPIVATPKDNNSDDSNTYNSGSTNEPYSYLSSYPAIFNSMLEVEKRMLEKDYKVAQQVMRSTAEFIHKYLYEQAGAVERLDHKGMLDALYAAGIYDANGYANFDYIRYHGNRAVHDGIFTPEVTKETYEKLKKETINFANDYVMRNRKINPDMGISTFNRETAEKKFYYLANYPRIFNSMLNVEELMSKKDYRNAMQEMNSTVDFIFSTLSDKAGNYYKWAYTKDPIQLYLKDICMIDKDSFNNFDYILKTNISSSRSRYTSPEKAKQSYDILISESKRFSNDYIGRKPKLHWTKTLMIVSFIISILTILITMLVS